jgi:Fe(3+) dicitrate transport protein
MKYMMRTWAFLCVAFVVLLFSQRAQAQLFGSVYESGNKPATGAKIVVNRTLETQTDQNGSFVVKPALGRCEILVYLSGYRHHVEVIDFKGQSRLIIELQPLGDSLEEVTVSAGEFTWFNSVQGLMIVEGKKSEVIVLKDFTANLSTNSARQVFSKVVGLNIWESDGAGLQLGIGGRGLSPNRTANFNTRQNGYDISADALGYPESYYTPPMEALQRIEVVRGAASLQYGTQFGGMVNFVMKDAKSLLEETHGKKFGVLAAQTVGSWGFVNSFNSAAYSSEKFDFYGFAQHKRGEGWRENSGFGVWTGFACANWKPHSKLKITFEQTLMNYLTQQPGGLTDAQFAANPRRSFRERNWFEVSWRLSSLNFEYKLSSTTTLNSKTFYLNASRQSLGNLERANVIDFGGNRTLIYGHYQNLGNETRLLKRYKIGNLPQALVLGSRAYWGFSTQKQGDASKGSGPDFWFLNPENPENSSYSFPNRNFSLFAENIFNLSESFSLTPGIRLEHIQTNSRGFYRVMVRDMAQNIVSDIKTQDNRYRERTFLIAGLGMSLKLGSDLELYGNFTQNYRAVTFSDLQIVNPNFKIDPNIQDERGYNADLGLKGNFAKIFNFDVTLFHLFYSGRIGQILRADQPPLFLDYRYRTNISDSRTTGLEATFEWHSWKTFFGTQSKTKLTLFGNLALIDARYVGTKDKSVENRKVELVPPLNLRTGLHFKRNRLSASYYFSHIKEHFTDATNTIRSASGVNGIIPSYSIMDLSAAYQLSRNFRFEATLSNLTNRMYFTRRAEAYPGPGIISSEGRGFYFSFIAAF